MTDGGAFYRLDSNGNLKSQMSSDRCCTDHAALPDGGGVWIRNWLADNVLFLDANLHTRGVYSVGEYVRHPAVLKDGTVVLLIYGDNVVDFLTADGKLKKRVKLPDRESIQHPVALPDGSVLLAGGSHFFRLSPSGEILSKTELSPAPGAGYEIRRKPIVLSDGSFVIFATQDISHVGLSIYFMNPNGSLRKLLKQPKGDNYLGMLQDDAYTIFPDGNLAVSIDHKITFFSPQGTEFGSFPTPCFGSDPTLLSSGLLLLYNCESNKDDERIFGFDSHGRRKLNFGFKGYFANGSFIELKDGTLAVTTDGNLQFFDTGGKPLAFLKGDSDSEARIAKTADDTVIFASQSGKLTFLRLSEP